MIALDHLLSRKLPFDRQIVCAGKTFIFHVPRKGHTEILYAPMRYLLVDPGVLSHDQGWQPGFVLHTTYFFS